MSPPTAARPALQSGAVGFGSALSKPKTEKLSACVKVINAPWNGSPWIKRRAANLLIEQGRAVFVDAYECVSYRAGGRTGQDRIQVDGKREQLRMLDTHDQFVEKRASEAGDYEWPVGKVITAQELLNIGVACPVKALKESTTLRSSSGVKHFAGKSGAVTGASTKALPPRRVMTMSWPSPPTT